MYSLCDYDNDSGLLTVTDGKTETQCTLEEIEEYSLLLRIKHVDLLKYIRHSYKGIAVSFSDSVPSVVITEPVTADIPADARVIIGLNTMGTVELHCEHVMYLTDRAGGVPCTVDLGNVKTIGTLSTGTVCFQTDNELYIDDCFVYDSRKARSVLCSENIIINSLAIGDVAHSNRSLNVKSCIHYMHFTGRYVLNDMHVNGRCIDSHIDTNSCFVAKTFYENVFSNPLIKEKEGTVEYDRTVLELFRPVYDKEAVIRLLSMCISNSDLEGMKMLRLHMCIGDVYLEKEGYSGSLFRDYPVVTVDGKSYIFIEGYGYVMKHGLTLAEQGDLRDLVNEAKELYKEMMK